jgi:hypothetical protein
MVRELVLSSPVVNINIPTAVSDLTHRMQMRFFKVNELANKYYANMADEN